NCYDPLGLAKETAQCKNALKVADKNGAAIDRANAAWPTISAAANANHIDPRLLASIGVRETGFQNIAEKGKGKGMGIYQLTNQPNVTPAQAYDPTYAANYAAAKLSHDQQVLNKKFPNLTDDKLTQA